MTTAQLLETWREAIRAAELAERLATVAHEAAAAASLNAQQSAEVAAMAQQAAAAATRAAERADAAADEAATLAMSRGADDAARRDEVARLHAESEQAASAYHDAEAEAKSRREVR